MPAQSSTKSALHSPPAPSGYCALSSSSLLSVFVTSHPTKTAAPTEAPLLVLPGKTGENLTRIVTLPTRPPPTNPLFKKETVRRTRKSVFHFLPPPQPTSTSPHFEASRKNLPRQTLCEWYYYMLENNDIEVFLLFFLVAAGCFFRCIFFTFTFISYAKADSLFPFARTEKRQITMGRRQERLRLEENRLEPFWSPPPVSFFFYKFSFGKGKGRFSSRVKI